MVWSQWPMTTYYTDAYMHHQALMFYQEGNEKLTGHYNDVIMSAMASQITAVSDAGLTVDSVADHRKHQNSASMALCRRFTNDQWFPKRPVRRKIFPFDDVTMSSYLSHVMGMVLNTKVAIARFFSQHEIVSCQVSYQYDSWKWTALMPLRLWCFVLNWTIYINRFITRITN